MISPSLIAAARALREAGYVVIKPEFGPDLTGAALDAFSEAWKHDLRSRMIHAVAGGLSSMAATTARAMGETEFDQQVAYEAVWAAVPDEFKR
jgi:hypothetical protein